MEEQPFHLVTCDPHGDCKITLVEAGNKHVAIDSGTFLTEFAACRINY